MDISPRQQCDCAKPVGTGRFIFQREVCLLCGYFIVTSADERAELQEARLAEEKAEAKNYEGTSRPELSDDDVRKIVGGFLEATPELSNTKLRALVSTFGTFAPDHDYFGRIVSGVRSEMGVVSTRGRRASA